jgi:glucose-6-phosphate 1-dehydrogenase
MSDLRQGCATGKPTEDTTQANGLVLFGAMGDLAHKRIFPALYHVVSQLFSRHLQRIPRHRKIKG